MFDIKFPPPAEKVILVGLNTFKEDDALFEEDLQEMIMLCKTAGAEILDVIVQKLFVPKAATYIGKGKLYEIKEKMEELGCSTLIIDAELSPGQIKNIESIIKGKVIDRSQLILDIFAKHAATKEARIQVELAQLRTLYPRLTHAWTHFSKQVGGIGTRGPGEKQLEVDRRLVQKKISELIKRLKKIESSRETQRNKRKDIFKVALVGYTNVGKSSILNALTKSEVLVENKLFATLDTATRKAYIPGYGEIVISDTVGFLRKLPHHLVASFKSTLEVVKEADLICVVLDSSSNWTDEQYKTVENVLKDLDADDIPQMIVLNKVDKVREDNFVLKKLKLKYPGAVFVSAFDKDDMNLLKEEIAKRIREITSEREKKQIIERSTKEVLQNE